jgi:hypothetical protein
MNTYTPRKKKIHGPSVVGAMKLVRIDFRTEIMVPVDVPDEDARQRYLERISRAIRPAYVPTSPNYPVASGFKEVPVGDLEDMQTMAEIVETQAEELPEEE